MKIQMTMFAGVLVASGGSALAVHADVGFYTVGSRLATRGWDDALEQPLDYQRVFEGELSLLAGQVFGDEPGYNTPAGTFSASGTATVSIRASLRAWTGSGFVPTTDRLNIQLFGGAQSVFTPAVDPTDPDTDPLEQIAMPIDQGELHLHPEFFLVDSTLTAPGSPGIYLAEFHAQTSVDGLTRSYPYWTVVNYEQPEIEHDAAVAYTIEHVVPAPATLVLLGVGAGPALRRSRRSTPA